MMEGGTESIEHEKIIPTELGDLAMQAAEIQPDATDTTETVDGGSDPAPGKEPFVQPEGAFEQTHDMIVAGIKTMLKAKPGGEAVGKVWEADIFKNAMIPVMQKYNISIYNLPVELVALGVIIALAKQSSDIMRMAANAPEEKAPADEEA